MIYLLTPLKEVKIERELKVCTKNLYLSQINYPSQREF